MEKVSIISRAKITEKNNYISLDHKTHATATNEDILKSVSGSLSQTSDGTAEIAYDIYKKR